MRITSFEQPRFTAFFVNFFLPHRSLAFSAHSMRAILVNSYIIRIIETKQSGAQPFPLIGLSVFVSKKDLTNHAACCIMCKAFFFTG